MRLTRTALHFIEPANLWRSRLPKQLVDLVPCNVQARHFRCRFFTAAQEQFLQDTAAALDTWDTGK
ncbi:hypothetical protein [Mycobacterium uberis]|uniref:hypothetical protein n=1 Tax=Mycobacterium uberis TaxID=2162698 RepID=UPI001A9F851F|nr:hypothetical protein [Mycobacterium uberis]